MSGCAALTGDVLGSQRCDCGEQLHRFMDVMACSACAVLMYIQGHEGRGNGLGIKLLEYALQDHYPEANHVRLLHEAGGVTDARSYDACARILHEELGIRSVVLHSNNPQKHAAVATVFGPERVYIECMPATVTPDNAKYLAEKIQCLAHDGRLLSVTPAHVKMSRSRRRHTSCTPASVTAHDLCMSLSGLLSARRRNHSARVQCKS